MARPPLDRGWYLISQGSFLIQNRYDTEFGVRYSTDSIKKLSYCGCNYRLSGVISMDSSEQANRWKLEILLRIIPYFAALPTSISGSLQVFDLSLSSPC